jgi:hypothetical protein
MILSHHLRVYTWFIVYSIALEGDSNLIMIFWVNRFQLEVVGLKAHDVRLFPLFKLMMIILKITE